MEKEEGVLGSVNFPYGEVVRKKTFIGFTIITKIRTLAPMFVGVRFAESRPTFKITVYLICIKLGVCIRITSYIEHLH